MPEQREDVKKLKAVFNGCDCNQVKKGNTYDIERIGENKVMVSGKNFIYTFSYGSPEKMNQEWSEL